MTAARDRSSRLFRRHAVAFVAVNALLNATNVATGAPWWAFWPLAVWGVALGVHYLAYKTGHVDPAWVEERAEDVRSKAYDRGHIDDIGERFGPGASPGGRDKQSG